MTALANSKVQYVGSVEWGNVAAYPSGTGTSVSAGRLCTNTANSPAVGNERCFVCTTAGTTSGTEPTFGTTKGISATDNTIVWYECTGQPGVNGDITNSPVWGASLTTVQGQIIYDSVSGALQMVTSNGGTTKSGAQPTFSATAGTTTTDNTVTWTSLGLASNFGPWAAPHARTLNADAATWQTVVPANIFISSDDAETQASGVTLAGGQSTSSAQNKYLCVSNAVAPPTSCTSGASISTTGANTIGISGYAYWYGVSFSAGSGSNGANINFGSSIGAMFFESCGFTLNNTSTTSVIYLGANNFSDSGGITYLNSSFVFGSTSQVLASYDGTVNIINATIAASGSVPSVLIKNNNGGAMLLTLRDTDLSKITGTLYSPNGESSEGYVLLTNCKLAAGVAMTTGSFGGVYAAPFKLHNCDSGSKNYRFYEGSFLATIQQETTIVDNTNPATNGVTKWSINLSTSANTAFGQPYVLDSLQPILWQNTTGSSITLTLKIDSNTQLNNSQFWIEVEYPGNSSYPEGSAISSRVANVLATPTTYSTSSDSWGGSETYQQDVSVTFTPQMVGPIKIRAYAAIPSTTIYISPAPVIPGVTISRTYLVPGLGIVNETSSGNGGGGLLINPGMTGGIGG